MTDNAKVMLSELEGMLINNTEWILTKHIIIEKVSQLLTAQLEHINHQFIQPLSFEFKELSSCKPKLSKGEKYLSLPYIILDYPGIFSKTDVFALRTMFWWGNFISVTLHLSGKYKIAAEASLCKNMDKVKKHGFVSSGDDEWEHHFEEKNYLSISKMPEEVLYKKIVQPSFIKVALKYDLSEWDNMNNLLEEAYSKLAFMIKG